MAYISNRYLPEDKRTEREKRAEQFRAQLQLLKGQSPNPSDYRQRAAYILQGGQQATQYEANRRSQREAAGLQALQNQMAGQWRNIGVSVGQGQGPDYSGNMPGGSFGAFLKAISGQESGGNYGARNRSSGAMGKYQIMPGNLGGTRSGWDYEALGRDISSSQFMGSPALQEAIAQYKLRQYYNRYGPWGAAVAWYAGPGSVGKVGRYDRSQGSYPSIRQYADSIMRRLGY